EIKELKTVLRRTDNFWVRRVEELKATIEDLRAKLLERDEAIENLENQILETLFEKKAEGPK
ncbi:MAG: hypothetical protein ACXAEN_27180, partial [Candidatus Thorarchaeota archaeon]